MSSPQRHEVQKQPEIIRPLKGPVVVHPPGSWYCCHENDKSPKESHDKANGKSDQHGMKDTEEHGRNLGRFCKFCNHPRCLKCKSSDQFVAFWSSCNRSFRHNYGEFLAEDATLVAIAWDNRPTNDAEDKWCRLCERDRCDDCVYEKYLALETRGIRLDSIPFNEVFRRVPVPAEEEAAVDKDEWNKLVAWTEAMQYQKVQQEQQQQRKQQRITADGIRPPKKEVAREDKEEKPQEGIEEITQGLMDLDSPDEIQLDKEENCRSPTNEEPESPIKRRRNESLADLLAISPKSKARGTRMRL
ncbi:hypothetical protein BKA61DRAFT_672162 [Leptodontidium sp. MPI-SDFR-AT-0119]|nr:hypothetical protein BKA61DRAFT_672162 [Leptodontidium sp. MPI-SDFR-AT-0119]